MSMVFPEYNAESNDMLHEPDFNDMVDLISVDPTKGVVEMAIIDDRTWDDYEEHMQWLLRKMNLYIAYVKSGQINDDPNCVGKQVQFVIHFDGRPPQPARRTVQKMRNHLQESGIGIEVTDSNDITNRIDVDAWANA